MTCSTDNPCDCKPVSDYRNLELQIEKLTIPQIIAILQFVVITCVTRGVFSCRHTLTECITLAYKAGQSVRNSNNGN